MKKILLLLLLFPVVGFCQDTIDIPNPFQYQVVDSITGLSADQIYSKAKVFITDHYLNPKKMIQLDDEPSKTLIVKDARFGILLKGKGAGTAFGAPMSAGYVYFDIKIEAKDNKSRITLYRFFHLGGDNYQSIGGSLDNEKPGFLMTKKQWKMIKKQTAEESLAFLEDFKKSISKDDNF